MSFKLMLGLENLNLSDPEIMARIHDAQVHRSATVIFAVNGRNVELHLPHGDFAPYNDPWDGPRNFS